MCVCLCRCLCVYFWVYKCRKAMFIFLILGACFSVCIVVCKCYEASFVLVFVYVYLRAGVYSCVRTVSPSSLRHTAKVLTHLLSIEEMVIMMEGGRAAVG